MISIRIVTVLMSLILISMIDFSAAANDVIDAKEKVTKQTNLKIHEILKGNRVLLYAIIMSIGVNIFLAISNIALPFLMVHILKFTNGQYGLQQTMVGVGSILAGAFLSMGKNISKPVRVSMIAMINISISLMIFGITGIVNISHLFSLVVFLTVSTIMGASLVAMEIPMSTYMQASVPKNIQGKVFSFVFGASQIAMPVGTIIGTVFVYSPFILLIISGVLMAVFVTFNYLKNGRSVAKIS
ncbi:hypothetical protein LNA01_10440 [Companilactobacillus nantensis]|nr:hypothetical protein LNA01_10440 [Companilactobacillus nantensis]